MSTQGMKCQTLSNSLLKQEGESRSSRDTPSGSTNYNAKGSKWAISTNFETLCNLTAGSSGKSSRDPSPRREMTTSLEQDKDKYDKSRRREMKNEKMGSKGGYNDTEPRRHVESERISDSRLRDAEWVVRERKPEYDASKQDMKKKRKKGDTFPRIKNGDRDPDPRVMPPEMEKERRHGHRPKREETQFWEEKIDKHKIRMRRKEDGKSPGRRPTEDERAQKRELYKMSGVEFRDTTRETIDRQDMRDRVAARRREDMRLDLDERNARMNSQQRTEREMYGRTQGRTVAKSEGDIDERRDKMRDRRGEEGDYMSKMQHNRDRDRHSGRGTEAERPRRKEEATFDRCTETDRRIARQVDKERERQMETRKDFSGYRREDDQIRRERRAREMLERREHATAERRNRSTSDPDPRVPPRVQSNRELTSSKDGENIRRDRAFYEERGPMTNWAAEIERIKEIPKKHRGGNTRIEQERRRMWLEPQKDRNSADEDRERYRRWKDREREKEMDVKSQAERARDVQRIKAEPNERDFDQRSHEGRHGGANGNDERTENGRKTFREGKGYLSDSDGRTGRKLQGCVEGENVVDDNKESGTEEEGGGDYLVRSGSEGGSDAGWMQDRDRMLSVENSSGGDEEDEREEEDKNVLCEDPTSASSKSFEGDERKEDWVTKKKVTDEDEQDNDDHSKSWGGMELRNVLDEIKKSQKSHGFFKDTQLYQQYIDTTQEFEILRSRSDVLSTFEDASLSPAPSPPPSRRPLPPLPSQPHLHSLSHTGSVTSAKNLPLPELPNTERRPSSPRLSISLSQSSLLWRELEDVRYSPDLELLTEDQRRLQEVRFEVVTSEASYCRSLDIVVDHFVKSKQLGQLLTTQDKNWLFSRLADVRTISRRFLSMLEQRMESDIMRFTVCDIIAEHCPRFRCVYVPYLTNQSYQDATYQKLMNGNPGFKQVVETLEKSQVCERLPLRSFLVLPFQRITRIKLLVQNIVKRTTPGTEEATHAIRALKLLEKMIRESNESISQMKNLESLVALNSKVNFECKTLPLVSQSRRLVREGAITKLSNSLKEPEKSIYLHLFNDYLLFSVPKEGGRFTVINHYPVTELCAEDCPVKLDTLQKNLFRLRTKQNLLLLRADSASDKLRWISAISPPQPIELSSVQDCAQMQCIRAYVAQQPDELSLEKADVILVHQDCDNWVEGTKLSDLHRGWMPKSHLEAIVNPKVRKRNLSDALKVTNATATA
ncbi:transcript variant X3 [Nothobranchius furzeri]|uniref:Transcript variant X3 n=1 Tax=Nothobranchius furzeri TaxID=105023 RepID=A0A9D2YUI9_NOTFU|nr:transcript variant X3 [Nothobranchius furzeri]